MYDQDVVADVSTQLTLGNFDIPDAVLLRCPPCQTLHEKVKAIWIFVVASQDDQIGVVGHEDSVLRSCRLHYCLRNQQVGILLRVFCEASSKLQVVTQHVDEVMFVGDARKEDIVRHRQLNISCEGDLDSDFAACAPLICCVLGEWNAVTKRSPERLSVVLSA